MEKHAKSEKDKSIEMRKRGPLGAFNSYTKDKGTGS